jgi:hypothetical protein
MVATRAEMADMLRAISSASWITRLALMPGAGSSSYMVTTGPGRTSVIIALHMEIVEHRLEQPRIAFQRGLVDLGADVLGGTSASSSGRGQGGGAFARRKQILLTRRGGGAQRSARCAADAA